MEPGPQNVIHEDGPHGYVHSFYEICVPDAVKKYLIRNEKLPEKMSDLTMDRLKRAVEHFCGTGQASVTETLYRLEQRTMGKNQKTGHLDVGKSKVSPSQKKRGRENGHDVRPVVAIQQENFIYREGKSLGTCGQHLSLAKKLNCDKYQTGTQWTFAKDGSHCCSDYQKHTQGFLVNGKPLPGKDGTSEFMLICKTCHPPCHGHLADNHRPAPAGAKLTPVPTDLNARTKLAVDKNFVSTAKLVKKTRQPPADRNTGGFGGRGRGRGNFNQGRGRPSNGADRRHVNAIESDVEALSTRLDKLQNWVEMPKGVNMIENYYDYQVVNSAQRSIK